MGILIMDFERFLPRLLHLSFLPDIVNLSYTFLFFYSDLEFDAKLAQLVQQKLDDYESDEASMGDGPEKAKTDSGHPVSRLRHHYYTLSGAHRPLKVQLG